MSTLESSVAGAGEPNLEARLRFAIEVARALHAFGAPAHRLERVLTRLSDEFGVEGRFMALPTAIFCAFGPPEKQHVTLWRVEPDTVDLGRLAELDALLDEVASRRVDVDAGFERLRAILDAPPRYPAWLDVVSFALGSGLAAFLFGGRPLEAGLGLVGGMLVGLFAVTLSPRFEAFARVFELVVGLVVGALAAVGASLFGASAHVVTLAGVIVLLPGLGLVTAIAELAAKNLASGTARLSGVVTTFLLLALGVAVGSRLGLVLPPAAEVTLTASPYLTAVALLFAPPCFTVLFRARPVDLMWISPVGVVAFLATVTAAKLVGPELGAAVGAATAGIGANFAARWAGRPAAVVLLPSLVLLVPGSVGFRSLTAFMRDDALGGVGTGFEMLMIAVSIVAGLLISNVLVPPRRSL